MAQGTVDVVEGEGLAEILVSRKLLTKKQVERIEKHQEETGQGFVGALCDLGLVTEGVVDALAEHENIRTVELTPDTIDPSATNLISGEVARKFGVIPAKFEGDRLLLAMTNPSNEAALNEVAVLTGLLVEPALVSPTAVTRAIEAVYGAARAEEPEAEQPTESEGTARVGQRLGVGEDVLTVDLHELLEEVLIRGASDLHLTGGVPPVIRLHGDLVRMDEYPVMKPDDLQKVIYGMLTQKQRERLENELELDLSYSVPGKARFRVNVYLQRGAYGAAFRLIPFQIKTMEELGLPPRVGAFSKLPRGLIVVTGPTGSGKSTTLASIVDIVNQERACHIMTIEDPIEFLHAHKKAIINQREVGSDTLGFAPALKHVLRQDPDVILVGEMRDLETIHMAITAAETGHLVFGTLHTQDAPQTVDRIIDVFPPHQQQQVRVQLASSLMGVVAQQLLQTPDGVGRVAVAEILVVTPAVRNLIREAKTHQIYSAIQSGGRLGMQTMDSALADLVRAGKVTHEAALEKAHSEEEFARLAGGGGKPASSTGGGVRVVN